MKFLLINLIVFVNVVKSDTSRHMFLPQLPIGEYRVNIIGILRCPPIDPNNLFQMNYYLSKTSVNTTEIRGNLTFFIPLDDSFKIEVNLSVKDSIGGWKDNAHIFKTPNACSSLKTVFGSSLSAILKGLGVSYSSCPFPAGFYIAPGLKFDDKLYSNLPKKFFYGTYKFRFQFTKHKVVYGCSIYVLEVKRPWETD